MTTDPTLDELDDRLTAALGPEPTPSSEIDAAGHEIPEDPDVFAQRYEAWRAGFAPETIEDADFAARRYRKVSAKLGEIDKIARDQIAQIEEWAKIEGQRHRENLAYWASRLEAFHRIERAADPKHAKTIALPCGVELRSQAGKISTVIAEDGPARAELVAWLEQNASVAVEYPPAKVLRTKLVQLFGSKAQGESEPGSYPAVSTDGEIVPGVEFVRGDTTYTIS